MRILLISSGSGSRGGGEIFLRYLATGLVDRAHEVIVWMPAHSRMDELALECSNIARVCRANYRNTYDHWARSLSTCFTRRMSRRLAKSWLELEPDVIHINKQNLEDGLDLLRAAQWTALPSLCTIHLTQSARYLGASASTLRDYIARKSLERYSGMFVAVQEARRLALHKFLRGRARTRVVLNGVPQVIGGRDEHIRAEKRAELGVAREQFLIIGLGRLVPQKMPFEFLRIAEEVHRQHPTARFLWVGDGELLEEWSYRVEQSELAGIVTCAGWQANIRPFLLAGDLLLHVAQFEGLPLAILEAMAAGLPCAVTPWLAEEIELFDSSNVLLFESSDHLVSQVRDRARLDAVSAGAKQLLARELSLATMTQAYEQLYDEARAK